MSHQQGSVDTQCLLFSEPSGTIVRNRHQTSGVLGAGLDEEEDPGVGGHVQGDVHAESVAQLGHTSNYSRLQPLAVTVPTLAGVVFPRFAL